MQHIRKPIESEMNECRKVFDSYLTHSNPILSHVLGALAHREGKMMRPILTLLTSKLLGGRVNEKSIHSAAALEFFHTASLLHDDVVDESEERRGETSVNCAEGNKVAVLVGDFILTNALLCASKAGSLRLIELISEAAQRLADGELLQLNNVRNNTIDESVYFDIIYNKTAALFAACAEAGALSVDADEDNKRKMRELGGFIGTCFQIRDDIFDYFHDLHIGKPTGNDMKEGKLTLPVIHALLATHDEEMMSLAHKVKHHDVCQEDIDKLVQFTKDNGGIDYAVQVMRDYAEKAKSILATYPDSETKEALIAYVDYAATREV